MVGEAAFTEKIATLMLPFDFSSAVAAPHIAAVANSAAVAAIQVFDFMLSSRSNMAR
jgi:hypothetical protein